MIYVATTTYIVQQAWINRYLFVLTIYQVLSPIYRVSSPIYQVLSLIYQVSSPIWYHNSSRYGTYSFVSVSYHYKTDSGNFEKNIRWLIYTKRSLIFEATATSLEWSNLKMCDHSQMWDEVQMPQRLSVHAVTENKSFITRTPGTIFTTLHFLCNLLIIPIS